MLAVMVPMVVLMMAMVVGQESQFGGSFLTYDGHFFQVTVRLWVFSLRIRFLSRFSFFEFVSLDLHKNSSIGWGLITYIK